MAKKKPGLEPFEVALVHMKDGKKAIREIMSKEFPFIRIDDTGLGNNGEFMRMGSDKRLVRYLPSTEDIMAEDWRLL